VQKLAALYRQFDPLRPLEADAQGDALYVDWQKELAPADVKALLVNSITLSSGVPVTRLFTGHRGVGKTTELMRVKRMLEQGAAGQKLFVSLLLAEEWVDLQDVSASEVVFQIVRQLVADLRDAGFNLGWTQFLEFFKEFGDLLKTEVELRSLEIGPDPVKFGVVLKGVPGARPLLRKLLEQRLPRVYDLVNQVVLPEAQTWLRENRGCVGTLLIVDQLDRIPQKVINERGLTNHENLYLDSVGTLRALNCHVLYVAPIELVYSRLRGRLSNFYGQVLSMPAIPVITRDGRENPDGLAILRRIVAKRASRAGVDLTDVFTEEESLARLCRLSGGHVRSLCNLVRSTLELCGRLPVPPEAVEQTLRTWAADLAEPLRADEWAFLKSVHASRQAPDRREDEELWNSLQREMFVLNYRDAIGSYCDWNPLVGLVSRGGIR